VLTAGDFLALFDVNDQGSAMICRFVHFLA